ncbi:MAG TPA: hypothetical protein VFS21_01375 [Roseiflexaceae bacterium]|nr:hypothetical protein [Roseiflexaceae bacterium]
MPTTRPLCFAISPFQLQHYRDSLEALSQRFSQFFAGQTMPLRLLSRSRPFSLAPRRQQLQQRTHPLDDVRDLLLLVERVAGGQTDPGELTRLLARRQEALARAMARQELPPALLPALAAGAGDSCDLAQLVVAARRALWPWRWLKNDRRALETIEQQAPPVALDHYLLCWPEGYTDPEALRATLRGAFVLPEVTEIPAPPALLHGRYRDAGDHLAPEEPGRPLAAILTAADIRGEWSLWSWQELLMGDREVALAIDIQTLERSQARNRATDAAVVLREAVYGRYAVKDARSEAAYGAAEYALPRLAQQNLHQVAYALLVQAPTLPALNRQVQAVRDQLGGRLTLDRMVGAQAELLGLFGGMPAHRIGVPLVRRNTLSQSVAVKVPWGYRKNSRTDGIEWGYDPHEAMPVYWNPWGQTGTGNAHLMMIGQSGSGKTVALLTLARRAATEGTQVIFFDPLGKCGWLCDAVQGGGRYEPVNTEAAVNILDVGAADDLRRQRDQVLRRLGILLGRIILRGEEVDFQPRPWTNFEIGALDRALEDGRVYGPGGSRLAHIDPARPPLLEDLVAALRQVAEREGIVRIAEAASLIADEVAASLLGSAARLFNRPTELSWVFDQADVVGYDFAGADKALLPLYYDLGFEALNAWVRSPIRKRRWANLIAIIDEFRFMASVKELEARVAMATKTWRNHGSAMWTADQNPSTYFGTEGIPNQWGPFVSENVAVKLLGRVEGDGVRVLGRVYGHQLSAADLDHIRTASKGQFVGILGDEVHHLTVQLTDLESTYFLQ